MWEVMISWFTPPTLLFLLLNFTIATIYVTSSSSSHKPPHHKSDSQEELHLTRTASVLQRLKSVNFYNYYTSHDSPAPHLAQTLVLPAEIEPVLHQSDDADNRFEEDENIENESVIYPSDRFDDEVEIGGEMSLDEVYSQLKRGSHNRSKSDMEPSSGVVAVKLVKKMKKSASSKSAFRHFEEEEILENRRPAEDEEVDSKADDFINKFKKQLQLQRRDSILRYKNMLGGGAHK